MTRDMTRENKQYPGLGSVCSLVTDVQVAPPLRPGQHVEAGDVAHAELRHAAHQPGGVGGGVCEGVWEPAWRVDNV